MRLIFLFLIFFPVLPAMAQDNKIEKSFEKYTTLYPHERIHVQFNKAEWLAGEKIFFKSYIFSGSTLSKISTNLYVELLDKNKKVLQKQLLLIAFGIAEGSLPLSKKMPEDVYYFRAYTAWMLNFDEKLQFVHPINIYNPSSGTRLKEQAVSWKAEAFPEGGLLMDKVESKISVLLKTNSRLPKNWNGYLTEASDTTEKLVSFQNINPQVGSFNFAPVEGKNYQIIITDDEGHSENIPLPAIYKQGAVLRAAHLPGKIVYRISSAALAKGLQGYRIVAQFKNEIIYNAYIKNNKPEIDGVIPLENSIAGLVQITLFDPEEKAASERLCFVNNLNLVAPPPDLTIKFKSSLPRAYNHWILNLDSVYADTYTTEITNGGVPLQDINILSAYWLGDIISLPYKESWYFTQDDKIIHPAIDALLITKSWQQFNWKNVLQNISPKIKFLPDNFITYKGIASRNKKLLINQNINFIISFSDSSRMIVQAKTDSMGSFTIKNLIFNDTAQVLYQLNTDKNFATRLTVDFKQISFFTPYKSHLPPSEFISVKRLENDSIPDRIMAYRNELDNIELADERYQMLDEVVIKTKKKTATEALNRKLSTPLFRDLNETVFDFINEPNDAESSGNILDWLNGKVAGLTIQSDNEGNPIPIIRGNPAAVYLDEWVADRDRINAIMPGDIAMIKVLKNGFLLGGPAIAIYTKRAGINSKFDVPTLPLNYIVGYPKTEKFKDFEYFGKDAAKIKNDRRSILLWDTNSSAIKGKLPLEFYNNDVSKSLWLIVTGFTSKGLPVFLTREISLEK